MAPRSRPLALITGGSGGIGSAICRKLARNGVAVWINYRENHESAAALVSELRAEGAEAFSVQANLQQPEEVRKLFSALDPERPLRYLVHCAALGSFKPTAAVRPNQWDLALDVGARAFLLCARLAAERMPAQSSMVCLSSLGAERVVPQYGALGPAKAALESLLRYLAVEFAPRGIRVNGVSAGLIETDSVRRHPEYEKLRQACLERTPLARLVTREEVAEAVWFLLRSQSSGIVGQILRLDGGMSLTI